MNDLVITLMKLMLQIEDNHLFDELQSVQAQIISLKERKETIMRRREELEQRYENAKPLIESLMPKE